MLYKVLFHQVIVSHTFQNKVKESRKLEESKEKYKMRVNHPYTCYIISNHLCFIILQQTTWYPN